MTAVYPFIGILLIVLGASAFWVDSPAFVFITFLGYPVSIVLGYVLAESNAKPDKQRLERYEYEVEVEYEEDYEDDEVFLPEKLDEPKKTVSKIEDKYSDVLLGVMAL